MHPLYLTEIEQHLSTTNKAVVWVGNNPIQLELDKRHERAYAAKILLSVRYPQSDIDSMLFKKLIQHGDRVLDAGANIGFTSLEMLNCGAIDILAVEAVPEIYTRLNQLSNTNITKLNAALGASIGTIDMFISKTHNQGSSFNPKILEIFPSIFGDSIETVNTPLRTIDSLSQEFGYYDVWKIDVEGAEIDLIKGAQETLKTRPPKVIIAEVFDSFINEFSELTKDTHCYQYRVFIKKQNYDLAFYPITMPYNTDDFYATSPTYVMSSSELPTA